MACALGAVLLTTTQLLHALYHRVAKNERRRLARFHGAASPGHRAVGLLLHSFLAHGMPAWLLRWNHNLLVRRMATSHQEQLHRRPLGTVDCFGHLDEGLHRPDLVHVPPWDRAVQL